MSYKEQISADIQSCMESLQVQPILFIGSGISQRYYGLPNWQGLMEELVSLCPKFPKKFAFYEQLHSSDYKKMASEFATIYSDWAWDTSEENPVFDQSFFAAGIPRDIYIKKMVCDFFKEKTHEIDLEKNSMHSEILALQKIKPHSVITTNYDLILEKIFSEYKSIIGQQIIHANYVSYGEILKIHGCCNEPSSIVLTQEDYNNFDEKKKYLSAKLLTYFAEHPLFFIGYSCTDPNIIAILSDIDEILSPHGNLIPNIYILNYDEKFDDSRKYQTETLIPIAGQRSVRIKAIYAKDYTWIFEEISKASPDITVSPKLLRALLTRTYKLVTTELPKQELPFDLKLLQDISEDESQLPKLFGISEMNNGQFINANYVYTLQQVGICLGFNGWHGANSLIDKIKSETNIDIKSTDNSYHIRVVAGRNGIHKYSRSFLDLLKLVKNNQEYKLNL